MTIQVRSLLQITFQSYRSVFLQRQQGESKEASWFIQVRLNRVTVEAKNPL